MDDNFGDHKCTNQPRMDGTLRAPMDFGHGSKRVRYVTCPYCNEVCRCGVTTFGMECPNCRKPFNPQEREDYQGIDIPETSRKPRNEGMMSMRKGMENKAQDYADGKIGRR